LAPLLEITWLGASKGGFGVEVSREPTVYGHVQL